MNAPCVLSEVVHRRAATDGDRIAYTFLADGVSDARSLTWSQLDRRATALAAVLSNAGAAQEPVLLALPSGLAFVESLLACWYAGAIAVPLSLPRHQRAKHRLDRIVADAGARFAVGTAETRQRLDASAADGAFTGRLVWIDPAAAEGAPSPAAPISFAAPHDPAVLQYTSGSTGSPRGVLVTHANLMHNSATIAEACGHGPNETIAGWLPLFHDMGLVGLVIQAAYSGARCVFMPPERFLMRPWLWLQMISDYRVCSSPAPNFAYDLSADKITDEQKRSLDLSCWRNALNGSEPVRAATLDRFAAAFACCGFRPEAFFPCYGLAEATLFVTGPTHDRRSIRRTSGGALLTGPAAAGHVACGSTFGDTQVAVVDPLTARRVSADAIGEIWVAGKSCASGYWNDPAASETTFDARLTDATEQAGPTQRWLRTGDLGFIADDQLFITGRLRELIIIAGRNHFPVDLERTAESADPALAASGAVAFSAEIEGTERLVLVVELRREYANTARSAGGVAIDEDTIIRRVRAAVAAEHDVTPHEVILLRPGGVPRTSSGKVSRRRTAEHFLNNTLERIEGSTYAHAVS